MQWWDATRPDLGYQGTMPGRSDITEGESAGLHEAGIGIGVLRETVEQNATEVQNQGVVLADYGEALARKVEPWAVPTVAPLSATINRRADPTFQLSDFMVPLVRGTSDPAGHNHTHTTTSSAFQLNRGAATIGRTYLAFITPSINRAYSQLNFMVSEVASPAARMDVAIYVVSEDRTMSRQVLVTDAGASLGLGEDVVTVTFPTWVATQGSYIAVAWLQHGAGNPRSILGLDDTPRPLTNLVFPRKISAIHPTTGMAALPASIDGTTQVDFDFWFTPYAELSEDVGIDYRLFTESWPDTGSGEMGRPWVTVANRGVSGRGGYVIPYFFALAVSMYDTPLSSDRVRIQTSIRSVWSNSSRSTLVFRGTNDMRSGVGLSIINGSGFQLIRWSDVDPAASWAGRTVLATVSQDPRPGDHVEVEYVDGLVTVRVNDVEVITGQSVDGPVGAAGRFVGLQMERPGNIIASSPSPWLGPWSARDLPPA